MTENTPLALAKVAGLKNFKSIIHILEERNRASRDRSAFWFFYDDSTPIAHTRYDEWTWGNLRGRSVEVSRALLEVEKSLSGARVLVVYPPGLGFVAAFFGCLYAGAIPVPVPAPRRNDGIHRWLHIARDAGVAGILCPTELVDLLSPLHEAIDGGFMISPDAADPGLPCGHVGEDEECLLPSSDDIAFLQYTSGSTSDPKGVMVTHGNLVANLRQISIASEYSASDRSASWLPHYHDMGLIDGILSPVYNGSSVALMAPAAFLRRPLRFLELVTHYKATIIGGPNFSYEHCVSRFSRDVAEGLDLSSIRLAYSGAEPIRPQTLKRFSETFKPYGFRWKAFFCCYGQAEATLFQTGNPPDEPPHILSVRRDLLVAGGEIVTVEDGDSPDDVLELAACGRPAVGLDLALVDPERRQRLNDGLVGEIWIRGPNVTPGYWKRPTESADTFNQHLEGTSGWRRTGDLGFRRDGQLYITGRLKDLIIIRGQNHHPEDIEQTVFFCHPALAQGRAGVFSLEQDGEEQVGVVCELTRESLRDLDAEEVLKAIRGAISRVHKLRVAVIALIRPGSLPRTPSGKVRRFACRKGLVDGELRIVSRWDARSGPVVRDAPVPANTGAWLAQLRRQPQSRWRDTLRQWLREEAAALAVLKAGELPDPDTGFFDLGLDSVALVSFAALLERELEVDLGPTVIFEHPTITALADHLASTLALADRIDAPSTLPEPARSAPGSAGGGSSISSELEALRGLLGSNAAE